MRSPCAQIIAAPLHGVYIGSCSATVQSKSGRAKARPYKACPILSSAVRFFYPSPRPPPRIIGEGELKSAELVLHRRFSPEHNPLNVGLRDESLADFGVKMNYRTSPTGFPLSWLARGQPPCEPAAIPSIMTACQPEPRKGKRHARLYDRSRQHQRYGSVSPVHAADAAHR